MTITQDPSEPFWENSTSRLRARPARTWTGAMFVGALLTLVSGELSAQQTAVCSDTPGEGERIECTEAADSSNGITLTPTGIDIDTMDDNASGVHGQHEGTGRIFVDLQTGLDENGNLIRNDIDTMGDNASGVYGRHEGGGNIEIGAQNTHITTTGQNAHGFHGFIGYRPADPPTEDPLPAAAGDIVIVVGGSTIETAGSSSGGVYAENYGGAGLIDLRVGTSTIKTNPTASMGRMLPTATSPSRLETAIPSPPPATTPTASWATIWAPENPGPWISRSGAASKPAGRARTASGWASSTTWEKWSEPPGWTPTATAGKPSGWTAGYTAAPARRRESFWRAAAGSTLGRQERSVRIPASPFAPRAAPTPNSIST